MPVKAIENLGALGLIADVEPAMLPEHAWSDSRNVRFVRNTAYKSPGMPSTGWSVGVAPLTIFPVQDGDQYWWVYAGVSDVYASYDTDFNDVKISSADYSARIDIRWTGGQIGQVLVLNNSNDYPAMWSTPSTDTALTSLTGWSTTWSCNSMRVFRNYLIAMDVTKGTDRFSRMVKWSHAAQPNAVPTSWDEADPTLDAGEVEGVLAQTGDKIIDGMVLGDRFIIYKEHSTYAMTFVGGNEIFAFRQIFPNQGIMSRWCAVEFERKHAVLTVDDVIVHDGQSYRSIANDRVREKMFSRIGTRVNDWAFVAADHGRREIHFYVPSPGGNITVGGWPEEKFIWNWEYDTWTFRDNLDKVSHAAFGRIDTPILQNARRSRGIVTSRWSTASQGASMAVDDVEHEVAVNTNDSGGNFNSYLERKGLHFSSPEALKRITRIFPVINKHGPAAGGSPTFTIRTGGHEFLEDSPTWEVSVSFDTTANPRWVDTDSPQGTAVSVPTPWPYVAWRIDDDSGNAGWAFSSAKLEVHVEGLQK
jgi:hypothetical protein